MYAYLKLCLGFFLVAGASLQEPNKPTDSAAVADLSRLEKIWNEAYVHADADALDSLCADDLVVTMSDMQVLNKNQSLAILRSGRVKFQRYETSDLRIHVYDSAAVVTGLLRRTRLTQGKEANDSWRFTKVYIRSASKWQVVAWHASTVAL
jgi:ketosteroid isomerase-like protein